MLHRPLVRMLVSGATLALALTVTVGAIANLADLNVWPALQDNLDFLLILLMLGLIVSGAFERIVSTTRD